MSLISDWIRKKTPIDTTWRHAVKQLDECPHNNNKIWQMALAKIEGASPEEIKTIKNNPSEFIKLNWDPEPIINLLDPEQFYEHYQELAPTREKQEQQLKKINTQLYDYCLIFCDFQYCNECDLIYNPPPCMIYIIPEEDKLISSCVSESKSIFNLDSNSDNNDNENNSSSSIQNSNKKINDSDFDQTPKYTFDNNEGIMPEHMHNTDAEFDLRYLEKNAIILEPHFHISFRNSLVKKGINIRGGIINTGYVENIIIMLQNNSKKTYIIEPNKKIAQAIFLSLVKIAQLVLMGSREELEITARGIQRFSSTGRINIPVNMYMLAIKKEVKNQVQLFEAEAIICESEKIGLTNLYISAKNPKNIKIPIHNTTENVIKIPKRTTIEYLTTEVEDQLPNYIPDFPQLCGYVDITSQIIYE
ncbi:hypothetical protein G9A89_020689 [Geosiphon pyriformis]|nr:hypothetical protein G9A89_020689 [Geosiphon pyriformis]